MAVERARPALPRLRPDRRPGRRARPGCGCARGDRAAAEATIAEIVRWRREHQPGGQNAGSVFVNPVPGEVSAGSLVDGLGLRGLRIGTAWVSEKHANFIQAAEGGPAADVRAVIEAVRARVAEATGFRLRSEVRLVGFDDGDERRSRREPVATRRRATAARRRRAVGRGARRAAAGVRRRRHRPGSGWSASTSPARRSTSCSRRRARPPTEPTPPPQVAAVEASTLDVDLRSRLDEAEVETATLSRRDA